MVDHGFDMHVLDELHVNIPTLPGLLTLTQSFFVKTEIKEGKKCFI